jgi:hypothetical protein
VGARELKHNTTWLIWYDSSVLLISQKVHYGLVPTRHALLLKSNNEVVATKSISCWLRYTIISQLVQNGLTQQQVLLDTSLQT